jgi:WD40 repeat protein
VLPAETGPEERSIPWLLHSLSVNTMNFCPLAVHVNGMDSLFVAAPSQVLGETLIFSLPNDSAVHKVPPSTSIKPSMQMALKLCVLVDGSLCLLTAAESGAAIVQVLAGDDHKVWTTAYFHQAHTQPVLGLDIASNLKAFYTCGADSIVAKHPLPSFATDKPSSSNAVVIKTGHAGQQGLSTRIDGKIFATAGWDSRVRVYSAKSLKEVAVLKWHKEGCYAVAFGGIETVQSNDTLQDDFKDQDPGASTVAETSELTLIDGKEPGFVTVKQRREQKTMQTHWLAVGSKDGKVSLWEIF